MDAFKIFTRSISISKICWNANDVASFSIIGLKIFLFFSESCLESFSKSFLKVRGKITAAAVTGPARQPLPASSVPHSKSKNEC